MAGLSKDKRTGIYVLQFYDPLCAPARKRVPTGVRDSRSAERLRRFWEAEYAEGRWDPWTQPPPVPGDKRQRTPVSRLTLDEARSLFLTSRAHRAANTYANYDRVTGWLMAYVGGNRPIASLEASDVQTWIDGLSVRPRTRANYVGHLRTFVRYCKDNGLLSEDITEHVRLERVPRCFPKALRPEVVEQVATYAETHARDGEQRSSAWCSYFIRLGADTALRRNELLFLLWEHVDFETGNLTVACTESFTTKSGAERRIPLSARSLTMLTKMQEGRPSASGYVFESGGRPIDPHTCSDTVKRFAVKAGVPMLTPHVLRHSCITWLIERGVPVPVVQRFAGHADIATTMRYCSVANDISALQIRAALSN